jgi:hypothetical protein
MLSLIIFIFIFIFIFYILEYRSILIFRSCRIAVSEYQYRSISIQYPCIVARQPCRRRRRRLRGESAEAVHRVQGEEAGRRRGGRRLLDLRAVALEKRAVGVREAFVNIGSESF